MYKLTKEDKEEKLKKLQAKFSLQETLRHEKKAKEYIKDYGKLPKSFKRRWLENLRSGKYKQVTDELCKSEYNHPELDKKYYGYCCLGVACKTQGLSDSIIYEDAVIGNNIVEIASNRKRGIPKILQVNNPLVDFLTHSNDTRRLSFKQIANWIDKNL